MCGITGFIDYSCKSNLEILSKMTNTLVHRGPDSAGTFLMNDQYQIGLGHRRLSIIDLSNCGNQPMTDETGNYTIVFNGEIYNFMEIRNELQISGFKFRSTSDTEVILLAYIKWGIIAVGKFIGMFAFTIYDKIKNTVTFCRDRPGVKPFYYAVLPDIILFGSELKSIMAHPSFEKKIDFNALGSFFRRGWIAAPHTIFESTSKLKPGHYLEINLNNREFNETCYWDAHDFYKMDELRMSFDEAKEHVHGLLKSACEYRMVADTEVGVFLSGGFDSSTVAAILQKDRTKKLNTFCIGFEEERFNEAPYAKAIAAHLGTNHHEVICNANDALELIPDLPFHYDEPFADSSAIPTMLVSKLASSKVKVSLSADGGDEIFGGYSKYYSKMSDFDRVKAIPNFIKKPLSNVLNIFTNFVNSKDPLFQIRIEKLQNILGYKDLIQMYRYRSEPIYFSDREIGKLFKEKKVNMALGSFYDNIGLRKNIDPAMFMMGVDYKTTMVDDILVKVDRATMAYSLEGREPLLDHRLLEFSARLNRNFHYKNGQSKSLLKEICYEYIPKNLIDRPKKGFSIPTDHWLKNELKSLVMECGNQKFLTEQNVFNVENCNKMIENYYKGYDKNAERIWFFLMFQMWYKKWMC
ncbi:MAG: asparagine synthase (glutamine-hydrolyzing) [Ginsengibacter sp.]